MSKENKCKFCEELSRIKEIAEEFKKEGHRDAYTVALVHEKYYAAFDGEIFTGSSSFGDHELNFCPTCGKIINKENTD